ncbi:MAG TPA: GntR family transcriptional regulator [Solirubrobacterales bacterium]|nr:GntR family transcriptional regulator [Solirubrobacterales bacterium]
MTQSEANPFLLDPSDELPLGLQLSWRLRALIRTGELGAGERLPSFRRLAEWAGVNVGTVRAVYEALEEEGLVVSRHGQGTFVTEGVEPAPELEAIATQALERARAAGFAPRDLAVVAMACAGLPPELGDEMELEDLPDLRTESEAIEVRQELRRQIARLEAELASYTAHLGANLLTAPRRAVAHVAGVEELEQTRDTLIAQLAAAQRESQQEVRRRAADRGPLGRAMSRWRAKR